MTCANGQSNPTVESDEAIVASIALGDRRALASLYDRHAGRLLGIAHWFGLTNSDAEDIVHDLFLEVWHHAGDFDPRRGTAQTWILVRLRSRIVDCLRRVERRRTSTWIRFRRPTKAGRASTAV